ncbi:hypothetical protein ANCDUO_22461 [Ancylostoma duodenale]|uniref:Inosine/uridine-preferring nucleoside hydrolase domain-containing protein n=1 Tax=Ancylostoma duodenale TaxID=51022 RepID=A0A0C2CCB3_9BILA|nr:hypothetical protein ANCDUO_22461 [Ancylostoma duodenale]
MDPYKRRSLNLRLSGASSVKRRILAHFIVLAFTTVRGCVSVEQATANVARCQRANDVQKQILIYKGAGEPLLGRENDFYSENYFFGRDGIGDQPNAFPEVLRSDFEPTSEEVAALALVRIAKENPEATLVCLGPLTNVAIALKIDPNFAFSKLQQEHPQFPISHEEYHQNFVGQENMLGDVVL